MAYAAVEELARILQLPTPSAAQTAAMQRVLDGAAAEIDAWLGLTQPYPDPAPPTVVHANIVIATEMWNQEQLPYGAVIMSGDQPPIYGPGNPWRRHLLKLLPHVEQFGVA